MLPKWRRRRGSVIAQHTDAISAGAGRSGPLAVDFGRRGLSCIVVERDDGGIHHPRVRRGNALTIELFRRYGIAEAIKVPRSLGSRAHGLLRRQTHGFEIVRFRLASHGGLRPTRCGFHCPTRGIARSAASARAGCARTRLGDGTRRPAAAGVRHGPLLQPARTLEARDSLSGRLKWHNGPRMFCLQEKNSSANNPDWRSPSAGAFVKQLKFAKFLAAVFLVVGLTAPTTAAPAGAPVEIPVMVPLTGPGALLGETKYRGCRSSRRVSTPAAAIHGRPLHFTFSDDQSNPEVSVQLANGLIAAHSANIVLGGGLTATCARRSRSLRLTDRCSTA